MNKILLTLASLGIFCTASQAQTANDPIDLEAIIALPAENSNLAATGNLDTNAIRCGIRCNTDAIIPNTQTVIFYSSFNNFPTPDAVNASGFSFVDDQSIAASSVIFVFPNTNKLGAGHISPFTLSADSIKALCKWSDWETNAFTTVNRADLVAGQAYGFFFKVLGVQPEGAGVNEYREDPVQGADVRNGNNRAAVKVIWNPNANSIGEMLAKKEKAAISVYPNPAGSKISFNFDAPKASHAMAVVRDITGKIVASRNFGSIPTGLGEYSLDVSGLSNGMYMLQFDTDDQVAVAKFTVTR
ncbi:T9SS type A sorting domain-containing protein [Taibaiella koreensis]|uniref:T9SS type A sorting domain-containing protein n=1 Tax=Taibaiella koreensis TaxID=1268548 RepID=UPI000E599DDB|nr:T9SS type A sorting domain-containing protein [Taibaiella koreensis]